MTPITYPARPINGGAFDPAVPKVGPWFVEPKYNGWRAIVHAPTGTMFNRQGEPLAIAKEFATALDLLRDNTHVAQWFDCEALDRRHGKCRGTLIILDAVIPRLAYLDRRTLLWNNLRHSKTYISALCEDAIDSIRLTEAYAATEVNIAAFYADLQHANTDLKCEFYEGIVMKQAGSPYPIQRLNPERTTHTWVKHRWAW